MISDHLAYVALAVTDAQAAAAMLERDFGLPRRDASAGGRPIPLLSVGRTALALAQRGDPFVGGQERTGVHHIALAVADPRAAAGKAREAGVPLDAGDAGPGLDGGERVLLDPQGTCGVRTYLSTPLAAQRDGGGGQVERLDHLGVACADNRAAVEVFVNRLGFAQESTQTDIEARIAYESFTSDRYGVVTHTRKPEIVGGLRAEFITVGDCELEFLQELDEHGDPRIDRGQPGNTRQDYGAIANYIARCGPGLHHLAFKVPDINGALAKLAEAGHAVIDRAGRPGGRASLIGFIHPKSLFGILLHLVERTELSSKDP